MWRWRSSALTDPSGPFPTSAAKKTMPQPLSPWTRKAAFIWQDSLAPPLYLACSSAQPNGHFSPAYLGPLSPFLPSDFTNERPHGIPQLETCRCNNRLALLAGGEF